MKCRSGPERLDHLGRSDYLADVALRVIGYVDERAADGRGQLLAADCARRVQIGCGQHMDSIGCIAERSLNLDEQLG